jgi:hypothetical protein
VENLSSLAARLAGRTTTDEPFVDDAIYPHFATFTAFWGPQVDSRRYPALLGLANGTTTLQEIATLDDRTFLFFVFATYCLNLPTPASWYFGEHATTQMKRIRRWMLEEDEDEKAQKRGNKKNAKHLDAAREAWEEIVEHGGGSDGDEGDEDEDSDENL